MTAADRFRVRALDVDPDDASNGAIDWARGTEGFAMIPGEIWDAARSRGAEVIQVNHPRAGLIGYFEQEEFDPETGSARPTMSARPRAPAAMSQP